MLYRHFPKIANKEFSILTLSLENLSLEDEVSIAAMCDLLHTASEYGINLIHAPSGEAQRAALLAAFQNAALRDCFYIIFDFTGTTAPQFDAFLALTGAHPNNLVCLTIEESGSLAHYKKEGILTRAENARNEGRLGCLGFSCPKDSAILTGVVDGYPEWDFFRMDFSFLDIGLLEAVCHAAVNELGFIPSNPFAGGILLDPPPSARAFYKNASVPRSCGEWALRALWENQNVTSIACVPASPADLTQNAIFAGAGRPNSLREKELSVLDNARKTLDTIVQIQQS